MPDAVSSQPDASTSDGSLVGRSVGKYEILRVIARGGMGTVYEALNTAIGKRVAMKFVDAALAQQSDAVARFQREAAAASAVESAHIVTIFDAGVSSDGLPFIVMELLRGEDLGHRIKRLGRLELPEALDIVAQLLRGLCRAHEAGIVHRDLKPDNVFLTQRDDASDFVKILDFGISKVLRPGGVPEKTITREGTVLGTPLYMSPEQAQALPDVDERTDLWSTGAILYQCITGRPPHDGRSYEEVIVNICTKSVPDARTYNPVVPEELVRVLTKALRRNRERRFQSAREMLEALGAASNGLLPQSSLKVLGDSGEQAEPAASLTNTSGPSKVGWATTGGVVPPKERSKIVPVAIASSAALATLIAAIVWSTSHASPAPSPPEPLASSPQSPAAAAAIPSPSVEEAKPEEAPAPPASIASEPSAAPQEEPPPPKAPAKTTKTSAPIPRAPTKAAKTTKATKTTASAKEPAVAPKLKLKME